MKASDISDEAFLAAMRTVRELQLHATVSRWDVGFVLGGQVDYVAAVAWAGDSPTPPRLEAVVPEKVVLAKARKLIRRGVITGCSCGCRGDFEFDEI